MLGRIKPLLGAILGWYRRQTLFNQLLLIFPVFCAIVLAVLVGNMGLALMGTAISLSAYVVGWASGVLALLFGKAGLIILKDKSREK